MVCACAWRSGVCMPSTVMLSMVQRTRKTMTTLLPILLSTTGTNAARSPLSSHIPFTALCISGISMTTNGMYTQAVFASSKCEEVLRAKKRAQISHAQSTRNEAQRTYWTADVGHPKAGVTGGATVGDGVHGLRIGRRMANPHPSLPDPLANIPKLLSQLQPSNSRTTAEKC